MERKSIVFTKVNTAEFLTEKFSPEPGAGEVLVRTVCGGISPGTERANITGNPNVAGKSKHDVPFPRQCGYSTAGIVEAVGEGVTSVAVGDRVIAYWTKHRSLQTVPEDQVVKITSDRISFEEAALIFISVFPLAAIRKTRLEIGESALVMGCGLLGQFAVRLLRAAGAVPIIAADPVESRRAEALAGGADYALDPTAPDFAETVKRITGKGAKVCIEVTGVGAGLDGALDCMAKFGRVALLGCTRDKEFTIDYYRKVHCPGITLIGAHTMARPEKESHSGWFTHRDDILSVMKLVESGRLDIKSMIGGVYSPVDCAEVYDHIINDRSFPTAAIFDWRNIK